MYKGRRKDVGTQNFNRDKKNMVEQGGNSIVLLVF